MSSVFSYTSLYEKCVSYDVDSSVFSSYRRYELLLESVHKVVLFIVLGIVAALLAAAIVVAVIAAPQGELELLKTHDIFDVGYFVSVFWRHFFLQ